VLSSITAADALKKRGDFSQIIDARTPLEFAEDALPGSVNWPSLDNEQRVLIGTMYKQEGAFEAKKRGAALVAKNVAAHIETYLLGTPRDWQPLIYCWRGGNRSGALAHVLAKIGFKVSLLEGGYREYRRAVIADLAELPARFNYLVICGKTGSGKTRFLQQLASAGHQVLDLEALANHRGSVLGLKPGDAQPSQKLFETRIWHALRGFDPARTVIVESESKKVGALHVPDALMQAMREAPCAALEMPMAARVDLLMDEYQFFVLDPSSLHQRLDALVSHLGETTVAEWKALSADSSNTAAMREFVEQSLVRHYDPIYLSSMKRNFKQFEAARVLHVAADANEEWERSAQALF
jgi:tRNA 2-selenouridine synthase